MYGYFCVNNKVKQVRFQNTPPILLKAAVFSSFSAVFFFLQMNVCIIKICFFVTEITKERQFTAEQNCFMSERWEHRRRRSPQRTKQRFFVRKICCDVSEDFERKRSAYIATRSETRGTPCFLPVKI